MIAKMTHSVPWILVLSKMLMFDIYCLSCLLKRKTIIQTCGNMSKQYHRTGNKIYSCFLAIPPHTYLFHPHFFPLSLQSWTLPEDEGCRALCFGYGRPSPAHKLEAWSPVGSTAFGDGESWKRGGHGWEGCVLFPVSLFVWRKLLLFSVFLLSGKCSASCRSIAVEQVNMDGNCGAVSINKSFLSSIISLMYFDDWKTNTESWWLLNLVFSIPFSSD